jgi:hypothetical protein
MPGELKDEMPVPSFVEKLIQWQARDRQSAQDERSRAEAKALARLFAVQPNQFDALRFLKSLPGHDQGAVDPAEDGARVFHGSERITSGGRYAKRKCILQ